MSRYLLVLKTDGPIGPDAIRFFLDSRAEATREIRITLANRGKPGEWGVILDAKTGAMVRRYRTDPDGIVRRVGR